jgi:hypothetical protein
MELYTVIMEDTDNDWCYFQCQADDVEHAEEQALDAYPASVVIWVNEGNNFSME